MDHKNTFDELIELTQNYRNSLSYLRFINFVAKIKNYSAYNIALIYAQNPNVTYVASKKDWLKRHNRVVKANARPLIILAPFHPVMFVFDVCDTEGDKLPDRAFSPFWAKGELPAPATNLIQKLCKKLNIIIKEEPKEINSAGCIRTYYHNRKFKSYILEVNSNHTQQVKFATLVHELAHLLCGHLGVHSKKEKWRERKNLTLEQREFEAESVSYIICKRFGIRSNAEEYLSDYMNEAQNIPDISIDTVLHVAGTIENAIQKSVSTCSNKNSTDVSQEAGQLNLF